MAFSRDTETRTLQLLEAITGERKQAHLIDQAICTKCNTCFEKCPFGAINKV